MEEEEEEEDFEEEDLRLRRRHASYTQPELRILAFQIVRCVSDDESDSMAFRSPGD